MIGPNGKMRVFTTRAALVAFTALAGVSTAGAQWFPPIGAAAPREIVERLRADGYVLIGPLQRRETVYLADVNAGRAGHERLVIDAWSGAILQRFVYRPRYARPGSGGFVVEGGEFDYPPPLGPPPMREFYNGGPGNFAYGGPPDAREPAGPPESYTRPRARSRPGSTSHKPAETKPTSTATAPPAQPAGEGAAPATVEAPPGVAPPGSPTAPNSAPQTTQTPQAPTPAMAETQPKSAPPPARPASAPAPKPGAKPTDKPKVNDVPVNPLD
jgi:hypothetical protein